LCDPELEETAGDLSPIQRRDLARKLNLWSAHLNYSADFIESLDAPSERPDDDDGNAQLLALAAQLETQALQIRNYLGQLDPGQSAKPKRAVEMVNFLAVN
jgi:hypothetical protein